jgi:hypothetical protein
LDTDFRLDLPPVDVGHPHRSLSSGRLARTSTSETLPGSAKCREWAQSGDDWRIVEGFAPTPLLAELRTVRAFSRRFNDAYRSPRLLKLL